MIAFVYHVSQSCLVCIRRIMVLLVIHSLVKYCAKVSALFLCLTKQLDMCGNCQPTLLSIGFLKEITEVLGRRATGIVG